MLSRRQFVQTAGISLAFTGASAGVWRALGQPRGARGEPFDLGEYDALATKMQQTSADALVAELVAASKGGTPLEKLVVAAALANTRVFGGTDYGGYHCMMALLPALDMAPWLKSNQRSLAVLKVIHRNTRRILEVGGRSKFTATNADDAGAGKQLAAELVAAERAGREREALATFQRGVARSTDDAFAAMQAVVRDNIDVHQVVLAWRSYDLLRLTGGDFAEPLLLQALNQCLDRESRRQSRGNRAPSLRASLPKLVSSMGLGSVDPSRGRDQDDAAVDRLADRFVREDRETAMRSCAAALADGWSTSSIGEALALASVRLLLHDPGRSSSEADKPKGSVHGASVGIHAADSANAWWHIAHASPREAVPTLLAGAWHTAGQSGRVKLDRPFHARCLEEAARVQQERRLDAMAECIRDRDQAMTAALADCYLEDGGDAAVIFRRLAPFLLDQDGALHHEKYFHTCVEEHSLRRAAFRKAWPVSLARVAASGQGFTAPGVAQAKALLAS